MFLILSKRRREWKLKKKKKGAIQIEQLAENRQDNLIQAAIQVSVKLNISNK